MSLQPGARLGPYEIHSLLGAGGMGEVYKARDTRLYRIVAIKILPEALAADPQFRERFEREARAISQLTHPHICTLYDVGRSQVRSPEGLRHASTEGRTPLEGHTPSEVAQGFSPAEVDFLVMEYLDGETLADRLKKGALPLDQAQTRAIEIASALDKAHRAGIVHRDFKPGNVMLTKAGAKLLDFGLAKTSAPVVAGTGLSMLPTTPPHLTAQGTILGTFQYMAPEQLEGHDADARTDIFAFGAVVYEMVTGKKAFEGKSHATLIAAIIGSDPPPISTVQPLTPPALDRVVKKCLAKEPDERWQSAKDLNDELKWIAEPGSQVGAPAPAAQRAHRVPWIVATLAIVALVSALVPAVLYFRRAMPESVVTRLDVVTPPTTDAFSFALSPDGRQLAFVANGEKGSQLWLRPLDQVAAQPLAGTAGASFPFWAPDGRAIGFFADAKLKQLDLAGGGPQVLADAPVPRVARGTATASSSMRLQPPAG